MRFGIRTRPERELSPEHDGTTNVKVSYFRIRPLRVRDDHTHVTLCLNSMPPQGMIGLTRMVDDVCVHVLE